MYSLAAKQACLEVPRLRFSPFLGIQFDDEDDDLQTKPKVMSESNLVIYSTDAIVVKGDKTLTKYNSEVEISNIEFRVLIKTQELSLIHI